MRDRNFEGPARCGEGVGRAVVLRRAERPAIDQQRYAEAAAHRKGLQRSGDRQTRLWGAVLATSCGSDDEDVLQSESAKASRE